MAYYRVVRDEYNGFSAEVWRWAWPMWAHLGSTYTTVEKAESVARIHAGIVVKDLGKL